MRNGFKRLLQDQRVQFGLWLDMADAYAAELAGRAGFDWLVIDGEHGPNDLRSILAQLQALEASPSAVVVRPPMGEAWFLKQLLDIGVQSLLIPMVDTPEQAEALVSAVRYPPRGRRGMGAGVARASRFNTVPDYLEHADREICLLVQAETQSAIANLEAIAAVEGVDGVFIGPADLAADMGFPGQLHAPEVQAVIEEAIARICATGKPAGIMTFDEELNRRYLELGATFVAVGADVTEFSAALCALAERYRSSGRTSATSGY
jgi:4-hydroxy-2-oxoheptanedioate aldolase